MPSFSKTPAQASIPSWASNLFLFAFGLRIWLTAPMLSAVMPYETENEGIFLQKIHPASWLILLMGTLVVPLALNRVSGTDRKMFNALLLFVVLVGVVIVESVLLGRTASLGYLLDSLITAGITGMTVLVMSEEKRRTLAGIVLTFCLCNCMVSIVEWVLKFHIFPDQNYEPIFRPNGIAGHPLETGMWTVLSFMLLWFVRWPHALKLIAAMIIMIGVASAGARLATAVVFGMAATAIVLPPVGQPIITGRSLQNILLLGTAVLLSAPFVYFIVDALGLLYRFASLGIFDDSAESRLSVYSIFSMVSQSDLIWGFPVERASELLFRMTRSKLIESSVAIYVFQFGLIGASILLLGFLTVTLNFLRRANRFLVIAIGGFWITAAGTLVLSGKSAGLTAFFALGIALRSSWQTRPISTVDLALRAPIDWRARMRNAPAP